jgi:hypothetical protein
LVEVEEEQILHLLEQVKLVDQVVVQQVLRYFSCTGILVELELSFSR